MRRKSFISSNDNVRAMELLQDFSGSVVMVFRNKGTQLTSYIIFQTCYMRRMVRLFTEGMCIDGSHATNIDR
ncbi:hypothetical protein F441_17707 [Phytophthora nicotianae CJ01A1]|uniref:ZSWIM1/3 RNaseH-like domain-containing protein n=2 Tax=Phytophthora nicotianae TaxID=4792 RepID=W2W5D1_PHYNI|nr:hypothetical protein F441_17707 [Phytophthora nicotianae CJ01A1]